MQDEPLVDPFLTQLCEGYTAAEAAEIIRNHIIHILEKLTLDYQNTKGERKELASLYPADHEEFTLLEEIELLTGDIRGYASQIQAQGWIENQQQAIDRLQTMRVFSIPAIARFYFATPKKDFEPMKAYIQNLDYLRLLIIEYLPSQLNAPSQAFGGALRTSS